MGIKFLQVPATRLFRYNNDWPAFLMEYCRTKRLHRTLENSKFLRIHTKLRTRLVLNVYILI
jgi:hypothetical protein